MYVNGAPAAAWEEFIDEGGDKVPHEPSTNGISKDDTSVKEATPGMFLRRRFRVALPAKENSSYSIVALAFCVQPPDHPGYVGNGGQGGDRSLAMDGAIMQVYNQITICLST